MKKIAVLFAGQGSQYIGMGQDFFNKFSYVKEVYKKASSILGYNIEDICFKENDLINETIYTQPCILTTSIAIFNVLKNELGIVPDMVAGFSLGEYTALYASQVFDLKTILQLIKLRAEYMNDAALKTKGSMAAIIGMDREQLENLCKLECRDNEFVHIANYNCSSQYVVGGTVEAVKNLCEKAKEKGAKRAIYLNVSGAFHTPLMSEASNKMYEEIKKTNYSPPVVPIIMNCNAQHLNIEKLPELMKKQIEESVYFEDSIKLMIEEGVDTFIEIGPGSVLSGLVRKIDSLKRVVSINNISDLNNLKGEILQWI